MTRSEESVALREQALKAGGFIDPPNTSCATTGGPTASTSAIVLTPTVSIDISNLPASRTKEFSAQLDERLGAIGIVFTNTRWVVPREFREYILRFDPLTQIVQCSKVFCAECSHWVNLESSIYALRTWDRHCMSVHGRTEYVIISRKWHALLSSRSAPPPTLGIIRFLVLKKS
jgi:hypothetical protein